MGGLGIGCGAEASKKSVTENSKNEHPIPTNSIGTSAASRETPSTKIQAPSNSKIQTSENLQAPKFNL
jgi:hypothetical protein